MEIFKSVGQSAVGAGGETLKTLKRMFEMASETKRGAVMALASPPNPSNKVVQPFSPTTHLNNNTTKKSVAVIEVLSPGKILRVKRARPETRCIPTFLFTRLLTPGVNVAGT